MQPYIIKSFKRLHDNAIFELQKRGSFSGGYVFNNIVKRKSDFLCDGNYIINSVIDNSKINKPVYTIGDKVTINNGDTILTITIESSRVIFRTINTYGIISTVRMTDTNKYIEPIQLVVTPPVKKPVGRPRKVVETVDLFTLLQVQIENANPRPIRIANQLKKTIQNTSIKEFLIRFFTELNNEKDTVYVDNKDEVQCKVGKRRSLGDLYMICKYYFPECTLSEVIKVLYIDLQEHFTEAFRTSRCRTINKRVWYYSEGINKQILNKEEQDEYNNDYQWYLNNLNN